MSERDQDDNDDIISKIMERSGVTDDEKMGLESTTKGQTDDNNQDDDHVDDNQSSQQQQRGEDDKKQVKTVDRVQDDGTKQKAQTQQDDKNKKRQPEPLRDDNGQPVIPPGAQRRLFEKYKRTAEVEFPALQAQVTAYKEAANFSKYDLSPQEAITGYSLVKAWKDDPAKLIKHLLTQAKTAGINVDIGQAGVDTAAITALIEDKLKPLTEAKAAREAAQQADAETVRIYETFVEKYPDALQQEEAIAKLLDSDPDMTPTEAYYAAKAFFAQNGLDWNKPLREQGATGNRPANNQNRQGNLPRSRTVIQSDDDVEDDNKAPVMAPASSSWADIIKSSMKDAGYAIK